MDIPFPLLIFLGANAQLNEWSLDGVVWNGFTAADSDTTIVKHLTYPFLSGPSIKRLCSEYDRLTQSRMGGEGWSPCRTCSLWNFTTDTSRQNL